MNIINYFKNGNNNSNHYSTNKNTSFVPSPILYMTPMAPIDYGCPDDMLDDGRSDCGQNSQNTSPMYHNHHNNLTNSNGIPAHHNHNLHNNTTIDNNDIGLEFLDLSFEMKHGYHVSQGNRKYQEDRHKIKVGLENNQYLSLFGVFDGHGGERASNFVKRKIVNCVNKYVKENKAGYSSKNLNSSSSPTGSTSSTSSSGSTSSSNSSSSGSGVGGLNNGNSPNGVGVGGGSTISPTPSNGSSNGGGSSGVSSTTSPIGFDSPGWVKYNHLYNQNNFQQEIQNRSELLQGALFNTYQFLDNRYCKKYRQKGDGGTTCLVALLSNPPNAQPLLVVANAGDSRGVLCRNGKALPLSYDHKPGNPKEKQRITSSGGKIEWDYNERIWRVSGILSVSRGIGDIPLKKWVVCDPEFVVFPLKGPKKSKTIFYNGNGGGSANSSPTTPSPKAFRSSPQFNRFFFSPSFKNNKSISNSTGNLSNLNSPQQTPSIHQIHQNHLNGNGNVSSPASSITSDAPSLNTTDKNNISNNNINNLTSSSPPPNHKVYYCSNHQYSYGEVDQFFVLATDGIWDVFENQELVDFINETIEECYHSKRIDWEPNEISRKVVQEAYRRGSGDNATVLIVKLFW